LNEKKSFKALLSSKEVPQTHFRKRKFS